MSDTEQVHLFGESSPQPQHTQPKKSAGQGGQSAPYTVAEFIREFSKLAPHQHRYDVFRDFVTIMAISLYNALAKDERYEAEYMSIVGRYKKEEVMVFAQLFAQITVMLNEAPRDVLGEIYMTLELSNDKTSQYFTPWPIAEFMAQISYTEELTHLHKPFITISEPACGSGVMVLAFAKLLISQGHNPCKRMWAQCIDIDRMVALMCYVQLSLWNIPAVVIMGNSLTNEIQEVFHTPAHYLGCWDAKLRQSSQENPIHSGTGGENSNTMRMSDGATVQPSSLQVEKPLRIDKIFSQQFDLEF